MAKMIPPVISPECKSYAEIEIFKKLKEEEIASDWIVLHSLDLTHHTKRIAGEIDFLVIIPKKGILCLEVKGCRSVRRANGLWFFGNNHAGDPRGPFKQVTEAMHSLRESIAFDRPDLSRLPIFTCVIFPYVNFQNSPTEWFDWQYIDRSKFKGAPLSRLLLGVVDSWREHFFNNDTTRRLIGPNEPYLEQCTDLATYLRKNFELHENVRATVETLEKELDYYTKEQFDALDMIQSNPRVIFSGPAGTGKTSLALESVKRLNSRNKRTLLLCFNKNLADWLKRKTIHLQFVEAVSIHALMGSFVGKINSDDSDFWENKLPILAQEKFLDTFDPSMQYDAVVIDEGQDILTNNYLDFVDLLIKGGFSAGKWMMFGDFQYQRIYPSKISEDEFRQTRCPLATSMELTINCRNTPRVGTWAQIFGNLNPGYTRYRRPDCETEPRLKFFKNHDEQMEILYSELGFYIEQGFRNSDIVILSPGTGDTTSVSRIDLKPWKDKIRKYSNSDDGNYIQHSSISSFKGLEAPVIIVTDLSVLASEKDLQNLYLAVSRSTLKVSLIMSESIKTEMLSFLSKG